MTTIVAMKGQIGGDSMVHVEAKHQWFPTIKVRKIPGTESEGFGLVGAAGNADDCNLFLDWVESGMDEEDRPTYNEEAGSEDEAIALMVDETGIYCMMATDSTWEKVDRPYHAVGSGAKAALATLRAQARRKEPLDLKEALEAAVDLCPYTRGPFTILSL